MDKVKIDHSERERASRQPADIGSGQADSIVSRMGRARREAARTRAPRDYPSPTPQPVTAAPTAHPRASRPRSAGPPTARAPQSTRQQPSHLHPRIPQATNPPPVGSRTRRRWKPTSTHQDFRWPLSPRRKAPRSRIAVPPAAYARCHRSNGSVPATKPAASATRTASAKPAASRSGL
jgi:hypothetical protein